VGTRSLSSGRAFARTLWLCPPYESCFVLGRAARPRTRPPIPILFRTVPGLAAHPLTRAEGVDSPIC